MTHASLAPPRRRALGAALLMAALAACARTPAPGRPSPAAADSARIAAARRDSIARDSARRAAAAAARKAPRHMHAPLPVLRRADERVLRVCAGGDLTLGTNLDTSWVDVVQRHTGRRPAPLPDPAALLRPLHPLFRDADLALVNVEGAIGEGDAPAKCGDRSTACFALRQPPEAAAALRSLAAGGAVVVGNVANNHARDAGLAGLAETLDRLDSAGVYVTGADTLPTLIPTRRGDTIAVLGFSTSSTADLRDTAGVRRWVSAAAARYPIVIATMHLGAEGASAQRTRDASEKYFGADRGNPVRFAHTAVDAGADLVIGHGPHVVRAAEWRRGALILYSLGNLLTYGPFVLREPLDRGGVACATLDDSGRVVRAVLHSTVQPRLGVVRSDRRRRAAVLVDSLSRLDFPRTGAIVRRDGTIVPRSTRRPRRPRRPRRER